MNNNPIFTSADGNTPARSISNSITSSTNLCEQSADEKSVRQSNLSESALPKQVAVETVKSPNHSTEKFRIIKYFKRFISTGKDIIRDPKFTKEVIRLVVAVAFFLSNV